MPDAPPTPPDPSGAPSRFAYDPSVLEPARDVFDVRELLSTLRRSIWIVLLPGVVGLGGMYLLLLREQVRYRAEALIRLRDAQAEVTGGLIATGEAPRSGAPSASLLSELMVLQGRQVAGAVVDREGFRLFDLALGAPSPYASDVHVGLPSEASLPIELALGATEVTATSGARRASAPYGQPVALDSVRFTIGARPAVREISLVVLPRENAVDWVNGVMSARETEGTDAIRVAVTTPSPLLSVRVANSVIEQYQLANAARSRELNRRRREFLVARLRETDDSLVAAQTALGRFRSRTGVYGAREQFQAERSDAREVERQRKQLLAEQSIRHSLLRELDAAPRATESAAFRKLLASPEVAANPMVSQLYARLTEVETKREEMLAAGRPPDHPDVAQLETVRASTESRLVDALHSQVSSFDARLTALGAVREQAATEVSRLTPAEAEEVRLSEQVDAMRAVGGQLRAELQRTRLAEAAEMGQVEIVDRATRALPLSSRRPLKLALGLALGLFLGVSIALLRHHLDTGLHRRIDVEQSLRVPGLAIIPRLARATSARFPGVRRRAGVAHATELAAEAYRSLRTRLLFTPHTGAALRSVVVTSAGAGEGKTTTAANLAATLAQQGLRVLLIDCDLRRPRLHSLFSLPNRRGLADFLLERAPLDEVVQPTRIEGLSLLSSGATETGPVGPSELLGGTRMTTLLTLATIEFDIAVLDTPPVLLASDASILAARSDGVLLVLRAGRTRRALAHDAVHELEAVGANVVGAVLNDPDAKTTRYRDYGYAYARY